MQPEIEKNNCVNDQCEKSYLWTSSYVSEFGVFIEVFSLITLAIATLTDAIYESWSSFGRNCMNIAIKYSQQTGMKYILFSGASRGAFRKEFYGTVIRVDF